MFGRRKIKMQLFSLNSAQIAGGVVVVGVRGICLETSEI